ncbi:MAG: cation:proton antiporter, partial [Pseudomonadota bacterium]
ILVLVILGGRYLLQPVLHRVARSRTPEVFTASAVLLVLGAAMATEKIGLSMAMGAFIAGLLIADSSYRHQVMAEIHPFRGLLLGLFFMSMGMSLRLDEFFAHPWVSMGLAAALMLIKVAVLWPLTRLFGLDAKTGAAVALVLSQSGEFALVLFAFTFRAELLSDGLFQDLLLVVLLSMLATPPIARLAHHLVRARAEKEPPQETPVSAPIVLAGFGRVGHRIGHILTMAGKPYVAIDHNASRVAQERGNGYPIFYGDVQRPEVLRAAGAGNANLVIVTLDDFEAAEQVVTSLCQSHPDLTILARGHDLDQCRTLRQLGASMVVSENLEASLELAHAALIRTEGDKVEIEALLKRFRHDYYAQVDTAVKDE